MKKSCFALILAPFGASSLSNWDRSTNVPTMTRNKFMNVASIATMAAISVESVQCNAEDTSSLDFETLLKKSLKPPTADTPQIALPSAQANGLSASTSRNGDPSLKLPAPTTVTVLIDLSNPQLRPLYTDFLVLQVFDNNNESPSERALLGGAKIPISKIRKFPVQFALTPENAIGAAGTWIQASKKNDFLLVASVCPESSWENPQALCGLEGKGGENTTARYSFQGSGISKLLTNLPTLGENAVDKNIVIRAPASLKLQPIVDP